MSAYELTPFRLLIDRVIPTARPHFRKIFPTIGLPVVLGATALTFVQNRWMQQMTALEQAAPGADFWIGFATLMGIVFVMLIFYFLAYVALSVASMDAVQGRPVDMGRAWGFAFRGRVLWTLFLVTAASVVSFLMCVLPGLIVWPLLSLTLPVMVEEDLYGGKALKRSARLTWWNGTGKTADSNFLQVCVLLFVGWLIQNAVSSTAQLPAAILQVYWTVREATGGSAPGTPGEFLVPLWLQLPTQVLAALATAVTWFYWTFGFALLYSEFDRRRRAPDLQRAIGRLTGASEPLADASP